MSAPFSARDESESRTLAATGPALVLVGGTARSGSTVADLMLGSASYGFSCGEVFAWFRPFRPHHLDPICRCRDSNCPVWAQLRRTRANRFHSDAAEHLGARLIVDSSKNLAWMSDSIRWARRSGMPSKVLLVWKEPYDLAFSFFKRDSVDEAIHTAVRQFLDYYSMALSMALSMDVPTVAVQNQLLRSKPAETVSDMCGALGVPYEPGQEEFWRFEHHNLFGSDSASVQVRSASSLDDPAVSANFTERWQSLGYDDSVALTKVRAELLRHDVSQAAPRGTPSAIEPRYTRYQYGRQRLGGLARTARLVPAAPVATIKRSLPSRG